MKTRLQNNHRVAGSSKNRRSLLWELFCHMFDAHQHSVYMAWYPSGSAVSTGQQYLRWDRVSALAVSAQSSEGQPLSPLRSCFCCRWLLRELKEIFSASETFAVGSIGLGL